MRDIKSGDTFIHTRTSREYIIVGRGKMKINDVWVESVTYYNAVSEELFTRELEMFVKNFTKK